MEDSVRFTQVFEETIPIEMRTFEEPLKIGGLERIEVKIFAKGSETEEVKMEISCEDDLFFHYTHIQNVFTFRDVQNRHKLLMKLRDYPRFLQGLIEKVKATPAEYLALFYMDKVGRGRLDIVQNMGSKFAEVVICEFEATEKETVRRCIVKRFDRVKEMLGEVEVEVSEMEEVLKRRATGILTAVKEKKKVKVK